MSPDQPQARAFAIADEAMSDLLLCHGLPDEAAVMGGSGGVGLVAEDFSEVFTLSEADPAIQEAFEWLKARGLAELMTDPHGEHIFLKRPA